MTLVELIGAAVSLFGLFFLFGRDSLEARAKKKDPEKFAKREKQLEVTFKQMGVSFVHDRDPQEEELEEEFEQEPKEEIRPEKAVRKSPSRIPINKRHVPLTYEKPVTRPEKKSVPYKSRAALFIEKMPDKRFLMVSQILFGPPKSLE